MFIVVIFLVLAVLAGMAIDIARHETARADFQNALDRGVLAAANSSSGVGSRADAERIIREYMASRTMRDSSFALTVAEPQGDAISGRSITASLDAAVSTTFMAAMGVKSLDLPTTAGAEESRGLTEIVLVLDVSGSMGEDSTYKPQKKIDDLKDAVKEFVNTVMSDENAGRTMMSIVPYSGQVRLPDFMASTYNITTHHSYSNCIEYQEFDFTTPVISTTAPMKQSQHFADSVTYQTDANGFIIWNSGTITNFNCPSVNNAILPFEVTRQTVIDYVDGLSTQNWTAS
ncbi:MAG: Tad domain-containing protein, partial [Pseudomonadota bacterium]